MAERIQVRPLVSRRFPSLSEKIKPMKKSKYPDVVDASLVGTYPAVAASGGGYVWDDVLEYRVWCHPERGAPDDEDGNDYFFSFATYDEAAVFANNTQGAEEPLALIRQVEYIGELRPGEYRHIKELRITEWPVEFLRRPRRTPNTIPDFLSPKAPKNRLDILRGLASKPE
jgi:putative acetyltransferase